MLRSANHLHGYTIHATDGDIGHLDEFYFDDLNWVVRYLVVDTGTWLRGRRVLISPIALASTDWERRKIHVQLTQRQVEKSPDPQTHRPVSRRWEARYHEYYDWPVYWAGAALWGAAAYPSVLAQAEEPVEDEVGEDAELAEWPPEDDDSHLQSTRDVTGYHIEAADGSIGHVADFILDKETWAVRYLVIDTRNWWPGKRVLLAPRWIHQVKWVEARVYIDLPRQTIEQSPPYDPHSPITREYEDRLHDYYGQAGYWVEEDG